MANRFTKPQWDKVKNDSLCVISFKDGKHNRTYGNLSYNEAMEWVLRNQLVGKISLIIPTSNTLGIRGLETREYKDEEQTLDYYLKCIEEDKETITKYLKEVVD